MKIKTGKRSPYKTLDDTFIIRSQDLSRDGKAYETMLLIGGWSDGKQFTLSLDTREIDLIRSRTKEREPS